MKTIHPQPKFSVIFAGGDTGGAVAPLLAVAEKVKKLCPESRLVFIGTDHGPEKRMAGKAGLDFFSLPAGKLRRYLSIKNILAPFKTLIGFLKALSLLKSIKPDVIMGAGGFVQVPVIWAGKCLGIPSLVHQQDIRPGLANKLCELVASKITVTFEESQKVFVSSFGISFNNNFKNKIILTGNPVRENLSAGLKAEALKYFSLEDQFPTVLVLGGGTGSSYINDLVWSSLKELTNFCQIVHLTGTARPAKVMSHKHYQSLDFTDRMDLVYAAADVVVCRAGLSTISELSFLSKTAIVIPMPNTHQEDNAELLLRSNAAIVVEQSELNPKNFALGLRKLIFEYKLQETLKKNLHKLMPHDSSDKLAKMLLALGKEKS